MIIRIMLYIDHVFIHLRHLDLNNYIMKSNCKLKQKFNRTYLTSLVQHLFVICNVLYAILNDPVRASYVSLLPGFIVYFWT